VVPTDGPRSGIGGKEVEMLATIVVILFVVAALAFAGYAFVRPFTHLHYQHLSGKLWRPLD